MVATSPMAGGGDVVGRGQLGTETRMVMTDDGPVHRLFQVLVPVVNEAVRRLEASLLPSTHNTHPVSCIGRTW